MGFVLFFLVGFFALLLASFPERNSDIALHLAHGKELADSGLAALGAPDAFGNHSTWLFDLFCYGVFSAAGGSGLIAVKAFLVVGLAVLLMHLSRVHGWWIPAVCTALALLAMSTRLQLQPATFSYFLLAVALAMLRCRGMPGLQKLGSLAKPGFRFLPLMVLFVIWVNTDGWFQLGLLTVACFGWGRLLDDSARGQELFHSILWGVSGMAALAAACLLNPRWGNAFELLPELRWLVAPGTLPDLLATEHVQSPFQRSYWTSFGRSPAGLAYYPLLGLSLASFLLTVRRRPSPSPPSPGEAREVQRWQWFLPWLALAIMSALQVRVIPFFAVLAAAVSAWNLQEFFAAQHEDPERWAHPLWRRGLWGLRALTIVLGLAFLIGAWPGWLQLPPYEPRRWAIELPASLVRSAQACQRWQQQGKIAADSKTLHLSRQTAQVFAWLCAERKGVWDESLASAIHGASAPLDDMHERLRALGVDHVIVHDPDGGRLFAALNAFFADPKQWPLLYLEGNVAIFGWRDPLHVGPHDPFAGRELDLQQLALRPAPEKQAPGERPRQHAAARRWWDAFWKPAPPRSFERDEAEVYLLRAEALRLAAPFGHLLNWDAGHAAGVVGSLRGGTNVTCFLDVPLRFEAFHPASPEAEQSAIAPGFGKFMLAAQRQFVFERDDSPAEMIYLAIRAAQRALAHDPEDAKAYLILGECYLRLGQSTRERAWSRRLRELIQLRQAQASEALNQAVLLNPKLAPAHWNLAALYGDMGYLDLALEHRRAHFELIRAAGVRFGVGRELRLEQQEQLQKELQRLTKAVQDLEKQHGEAAAGMRIFDRARLAAHKGLAGKARQILVGSDVAAFGPQGMALELDLLLRTGRAKAVREWTDPEQAAALGLANFHWLRAQAFAASGDYALADEELTQLAAGGQDPKALPPRALLAVLVSQYAALEGRVWETSLGELVRRVVVRSFFQDRVDQLTGKVRQAADVMVLRGLLALEQGRMDDAEAALRVALVHWRADAAAGHAAAGEGGAGGIDFHGRVIAEGWLRKLQK